MEFSKLIEKRRSANNFMKEVSITEADLKAIFDDVKYTPTAFNLQHAHYISVINEDVKEQIREAAYGQYKIHSAELNKGMLDLGIITEIELENIINEYTDFYESRGEQFMKEEAIRNASISGMMFMLAAKNRGWDTCPMIGFDQDKVRQILNIDANHEIVLMITIGKEKESSRRLRGYRKPVNEFVKVIN